MAEVWKETRLQLFFNKIDFLFIGLRLFYLRYMRYARTKNYYLFFFFFPQKILRINGGCFWPVHFTSRVLFPKKIKVGKNSAPGLSNGCYLQGKNGIVIGDNVRIGPGVGIISANHNPNDYDQWLKEKPIVIGNNVWIGMNVVVLPGVTIGNNVIVGSNTVVNKDIPSNVVVAGNPLKIIKEKGEYKGVSSK